MTIRIGIYIYPGAEVLDFAGPYEVFSTASRVAQRRDPAAPALFDLSLIAAAQGPVRARGGFTVLPDHTLADHPPLEVLLVPGGVHEPELERREVVDWIARQASAVSLVASVCTGAFLLARAGVLAGMEATTHFEDAAALQRSHPEVQVREGVRWIEQERVLTSAGISAGLDMSLRIVARLAGQTLAEGTARQMDYEWRDRGGTGGPP
ncbi:MAG TPA: DJ-1/PfpI family protein [Anaeromyxobacter sp.]|nr:DJ-1/PfpI family protein [Anaeromyxobacter sp.]